MAQLSRGGASSQEEFSSLAWNCSFCLFPFFPCIPSKAGHFLWLPQAHPCSVRSFFLPEDLVHPLDFATQCGRAARGERAAPEVGDTTLSPAAEAEKPLTCILFGGKKISRK